MALIKMGVALVPDGISKKLESSFFYVYAGTDERRIVLQ